MNTPQAKKALPIRRVLRRSPLLFLACVGIFLFPSSAAADPFTTSFDAGQVNLGFAFKGREILPAPQSVVLGEVDTPLPDLWQARETASTPLGEGTPPNSLLSFKPAGCITPYTYRVVNPTGPVVAPNDGQEGRPTTPNPDYPCDPNPEEATISGDIDEGGAISAPASGVRFPIMIVPNPLTQTPVPITLVANGPLGGQFSEDGNMSLTGSLEVRVLTGLASDPLGTYCSLDLPDRSGGGALELTSSYSLPGSVGFQGTPFLSPSGPGALTGTWDIVSDAESVGGADCQTVNSVSKGLGGIWLGAGVSEPAPYPTCADSGQIGVFPNCTEARAAIGKVSVAGPGQIRRGKKATWRVLVRSTGNVALEGVSVSAVGRGVRTSRSAGKIEPDQSRTVSLSAKVRKAGKLRVTFTVRSSNAGSKKVVRTVRVR